MQVLEIQPQTLYILLVWEFLPNNETCRLGFFFQKLKQYNSVSLELIKCFIFCLYYIE